jgi:hypothetical protein
MQRRPNAPAMMRSFLAVALALALAVALGAPSAGAAENEAAKAAARTKVQEGVARYERGDFQGALTLFDEAYSLFATPVIQFNRAQALRGLHREADAARALEHFLRDATTASPERRAEAEQDLREIQKVLGRLKIVCDTDGAEVIVDDRMVGTTPLGAPVWIKAGSHLVKIQKAGARSFVRSIEIAATKEHVVEATLGTVADKPTATAVAGTAATAATAATTAATGGETPPADAGIAAGGSPGQPAAMSHARRVGLFLRADLSLIGEAGMVVVPGITYGLNHRFEVGAGALIGYYKGAVGEVRVLLLEGRWKPVVRAAVPVFVVDGAQIGLQVGAGLLVELGAHVGIVAEATGVYFPGAPSDMDKAWFIPSVGTQLRL